jgi:hypothetical protein
VASRPARKEKKGVEIGIESLLLPCSQKARPGITFELLCVLSQKLAVIYSIFALSPKLTGLYMFYFHAEQDCLSAKTSGSQASAFRQAVKLNLYGSAFLLQ